MVWRAIGLLMVLMVSWLLGPHRAEADADAHTYALIIGANRGGHGQPNLRYAADDARQVAALLVELGRARRDQIELLIDPSPERIEQALARLRKQLSQRAQQGESAKLLFYYSGHAQARALSLAGGELPLEVLRAALLGLPSTLTVAVLDACQSGAFSGVKGAVPAADFSVSSVQNLNNTGVAVMASSTAAELSQESAELGGSYFTHHLLTALRGAADRDHDGTVSLDEAYGYAYQNTLSDTLRTRVGSQHATLEMELKGHGSVPLSYPVDADAQLRFSKQLEARLVVQQARRGAVLAELTKSRGSALTLALPHGNYEVLVRRHPDLDPLSCSVLLLRGALYELDPRGCETVERPPALAAKGGNAPFERLFFELGVARRLAQDDAYIDTLKAFRFRDVGDFVVADDAGSFTPQLVVGLGLSPRFSLVTRIERLQRREFERRIPEAGQQERVDTFAWQTWAWAVGVRSRFPMLHERLVPFVEGNLGLGIAGSVYRPDARPSERDFQFGVVLRIELGATLDVYGPVGMVLSAGYDFARALENELEEAHNDGGFQLSLGLRVRLMSKGS